MADKAITDLNTIPGSVDDNNTWFAVAQSGTAYKVSGHEFVLALGTILDGHGGVKSIVYTDPVPPSLTGTMVITLADNNTVSLSITNGKGITSIAKTGTSDLVDTYTISYNDNTTSSFTVTNGAKGDTGDSWYVWIRYAGSRPTSDADIGTTPDDWIGIYSGVSSTAPVHYTDYDWFKFKGDTGDTGATGSPGTSISSVTLESGTHAPGTYDTYNVNLDNSTVAGQFSVYNGSDGQGSPGAQLPIMDGAASAGSASAYSREDHIHPTDTSRQATLVSGTNIKTVNGTSILGSGNIAAIPTGGNSAQVLAKASGSNYDVQWVSLVKTASMTISHAAWSGSSPYTQTVTISGATITSNTKVDIQPDATAIEQMIYDGVIAMFVTNNSGTLTLTAVGAATSADITVQVEFYETA